MPTIFFLLRAALLWASIFGYCMYLKKYMHPAFTPIVTLSSIGVLIFVAGLLNVMLISVYLICLGGWVCLYLTKPFDKDSFANNKQAFIIFGLFSAICGLFALRVYNQVPTHYDCFSHWLTVFRDMFVTNSMPNFKSALIAFQGYPTGSAGFLYFICRALEISRDDFVLFAQTILYAAAITSFAAFIKRLDVFGIFIAIAGSLFCLSAQTLAFEFLLVDTLISLISIAVVACLIYYRKDVTTGVFISLPLQLFLVAVKNSGIVMVALNFVLVCALAIAADYTAKKKISVLKLAKLGGLTAGIPAVLYFLWLQHVDYVFAAGSLSKHTASIDNYKQTLSSLSTEQMKEILTIYFKRFISWNPAWQLLIMTAFVIVVGILVKKFLLKTSYTAEPFILLGILGSYLAFMAILAAMYLLSMPYAESIILAAYDRYEKTILVYIIGIITIYALSLVSLLPNCKKESLIKLGLLLMVSVSLITQATGLKFLFTPSNTYTESTRYVYDQIKNTYSVQEGKSYFIYVGNQEDVSSYDFHMTRYIFWSPNVYLCTADAFAEKKATLENYDYLIIANYDDQINHFLSQHEVKLNKQAYLTKGELT